MQQSISTLKISKYIVKRLKDQGFIYCNDLIDNIDSINLSSEIKNDIQEQITFSRTAKSALELAEAESKIRKIPTFCKELDNILHGGIALQNITEFCGAPGSGKTQYALQLCVDVQIPREFGGLESGAVFIGTNCGFTTLRLSEIASSCVAHFHNVVEHKKNNLLERAVDKFTVHSILSKTHYIEVQDHVQLLAAIEYSKSFIQTKEVKLLIIDCISFLLRYGVPMLLRTRLLYKILTDLQNLCVEQNLAVVLTNEITTRLFGGYDGLVPALGESYAHMIPTRILLGAGPNNERIAFIDKSRISQRLFIPFQISNEGIRDYNNETKML